MKINKIRNPEIYSLSLFLHSIFYSVEDAKSVVELDPNFFSYY